MVNDTDAVVYLVVLTAGHYSDGITRTLRGFTDEKAAQGYIEEMYHIISKNAGLQHAVAEVMVEWDKANPTPINLGAGMCMAHARRSEEDRLLTLVGWNASLHLGGWDEYDLFIQTVPLARI